MTDYRDDWLFDLLVALCDHAHDKGFPEVSQRLEEALDAYLSESDGAVVVPFRTAREPEEKNPALYLAPHIRVSYGR